VVTARSVLRLTYRIVLVTLLLAAALYFFYLASFNWWAAGGPPTPNPQFFEVRGNVFFAVGLAHLLLGIVFLVLFQTRKG
jgi:hypothetical protein